MAISISTIKTTVTFLVFFTFVLFCSPYAFGSETYTESDALGLILPIEIDLFEFALNLQYLEAEFFLGGAIGQGLDNIDPNLAGGGPQPIGIKIATLSPIIRDIMTQFAYVEVGQLSVPGFPRPLLNLSAATFAEIMDKAIGQPLTPPFDPYANDINFLLASYIVPYVGVTGLVGGNPILLAAGFLGVDGGQDAVIRTLLYERASEVVTPYTITVADFTNRISDLRNRLGNAGLKDEGLIVNPSLGAEGRISGNVIAGNQFSLSYDRTPQEILRILYASGRENKPGGFYPNGADGKIARAFLLLP